MTTTAMRSNTLPTRRAPLLLLLLATALLLPSAQIAAENAKSRAKMAHSNPVLPVLVDGKEVNLILTTDVDGIMICTDLPQTSAAVSPIIDFDYARRLLRFQLDGLILQEFAVIDIAVPALQFAGKMPLGYFTLKRQWLSPASIEHFLLSSQASGFIGVGLAFRPMHSRFWTMVNNDFHGADTKRNNDENPVARQQYSYRGFATNGTLKLAALTARNDTTDRHDGDRNDVDTDEGDLVNGYISRNSDRTTERVWSEPLASISGQDDASNAHGISFPIHRAFFQCAPMLASESSSSSASASASLDTPHAAHDVELFGEFSTNWDVTLDFNAPCLVLPQQFFDALAGWTGLRYNDELKLAEMSSSALLPEFVFSLALDGPQLTIPLQQLVLPELDDAVTPANASAAAASMPSLRRSSTTTTTRLCIQRSGSIFQNGAAVFATLDQDAGSVQRYRLHGSLALPLFNMFQAPVVFGAMVLNLFDEIIVDGVTKQTALRSRRDGADRYANTATASTSSSDSDSDSSATFATCMRRMQCTGEQTYMSRLNACHDPDCSLFYFQSLDASTKRCVVDAGWTLTLVLTVAGFLFAELLITLTIKRLVTKGRTTAAARASS